MHLINRLKQQLLTRPRLLASLAVPAAARYGCRIRLGEGCFSVTKARKEIRVATRHGAYLLDIIREFDYYARSVVPVMINGIELADFSQPALHAIPGLGIEIYFNSFPEGADTNATYLNCLHPVCGFQSIANRFVEMTSI